MKVQIVSDEFFSWGVYGGFGQFSRKLGGELVKRGIEVEAIVHRVSGEQKPIGEYEIIDGVKVITLPRKKVSKIRARELYKTDADIIHSQSAMFDTWLSFKMNKKAYKIITFQDPRTPDEIKLTRSYEPTSDYKGLKRAWGRIVQHLFSNAVSQADLVASQTDYKIPYVKKRYGIKGVMWLPNMIDVPESMPIKSKRPLITFLGRLDPIKRPELFCQLVRNYPYYDFCVMGKSHFGLDERLKKEYRYSNLDWKGFTTGKEKEEILNKTWILVNTSVYECLPISFLEALAHGCSILSFNNPDTLTNRFGYWVVSYEPPGQCYSAHLGRLLSWGLDRLIGDESWKDKGRRGYEYVKAFYDTPKVVDQHLELYKRGLFP